ncbi:MAG: SDR family NAD(P)-dependent oxidoreductase, partial [Candidatus Omnitrophica bacterium]|nr:SDR family NAD(P)-dependent oxidoreductase [Candidatus Omnitrophota bacterium]
MADDKFGAIQIGDSAQLEHTISPQDVADFVALTGDNNPLHVDEHYAASTSFKKPVVHGMLTASFISTLIGTKLPGEGSLWYEQSLRFLAPVRVGDKITVIGTVRHKSEVSKALVINIQVREGQGKTVIEGDVKVKILQDGDNDPYRSDTDPAWQRPAVAPTANDQSPKGQGAVLITGGGRGIGAAVARELAAGGIPVVINYCHSQSAAEEVVRAIQEHGGAAVAVQADIREREQVSHMIRQAVDRFGPIAGLVHGAAAPIGNSAIADLSWEQIQEQFDIQIKGGYHVIQE